MISSNDFNLKQTISFSHILFLKYYILGDCVDYKNTNIAKTIDTEILLT